LLSLSLIAAVFLPVPQGVIENHLGHCQRLFLVLLLHLFGGFSRLFLNFLNDVIANTGVFK
jgi:hypothetical protein